MLSKVHVQVGNVGGAVALTPPPAALLPASGRFIPGQIAIRPANMLRIQGYKDPDTAPQSIVNVAERMLARAYEVFEPVVHYRMLSASVHAGGRSEGVIPLNSPLLDIEQLPSKSVAQLAVVLTLGAAIDEEVNRLQAGGELVEALFLEAAGWMGLEAATKAFESWIKIRLGAHGYERTRRFAPGYGDWPLTGQCALFATFGASALPVHLLESCAMIPKMSRSAVYGVVAASSPDLRYTRSKSMKRITGLMATGRADRL